MCLAEAKRPLLDRKTKGGPGENDAQELHDKNPCVFPQPVQWLTSRWQCEGSNLTILAVRYLINALINYVIPKSKAPIAERPGRPLADPGRDTRAQLIRAATELFAEQGVAATTLTTIARRAGLTPAMVHYYFKDRDQLIDAVVNEHLVPIVSYVWDPVTPEEDPATMLRGLVERMVQQIEHAPWVPSTWMREILNENGLLRTRVLPRLPLEKVRLVGQAIGQAQARGNANSDLEPLLVVFSILGLVMVHMATARMWAAVFHRAPLDPQTIQRHITGLLLNGIAPATKPGGKKRAQSSARRKS